jgi:hypothetical protein
VGHMTLVKSGSKSAVEETAEYIGGLAKELRAMAAKADLGFLAYLLAMVEQEAEGAAKSSLIKGKSGNS